MSLIFTASVTRLRAELGAPDRHGGRARDWAHASRVTWTGVSVQPSGRSEEHEPGARDRVDSGWSLQSAPLTDLDLLTTDRVELETGEVCEVVGEPARLPDPFGRGVHHVQVQLARVSG